MAGYIIMINHLNYSPKGQNQTWLLPLECANWRAPSVQQREIITFSVIAP